MSIVSKDIEVLDSFFNEQQELGAKKVRKEMMPIVAIMCIASLVIGTQLAASPQEQPSIISQVEPPTLPIAYDFTAPLPDLAANPLEIPPTFNSWIDRQLNKSR